MKEYRKKLRHREDGSVPVVSLILAAVLAIVTGIVFFILSQTNLAASCTDMKLLVLSVGIAGVLTTIFAISIYLK